MNKLDYLEKKEEELRLLNEQLDKKKDKIFNKELPDFRASASSNFKMEA